jgi:hypothetical protein
MTSFDGGPEEHTEKRRYQRRGRFTRPFRQRVVQLETVDEVEARLISAATGGAEMPEWLECGLPDVEGRAALRFPISTYCRG